MKATMPTAKKLMMAILLGFVFLTAASSSWGAQLLSLTDAGRLVNGLEAPKPDTALLKAGWKSSVARESKSSSDYLVYDLAGKGLDPYQGSLVFVVRRGESHRFPSETLIALSGADWSRKFNLTAGWDDQLTSIALNGLEGLATSAYLAGAANPSNGGKLTVVLAWKEGIVDLTANGVRIGLDTKNVTEAAPFIEALKTAKYLTLGGMAMPGNPAGSYEPLASSVQDFALFDTYDGWVLKTGIAEVVAEKPIYGAGQTAKVILKGASGATASFTLAGVGENVPMTETGIGVYEGTVAVPPGVNLVAPLTGILVVDGKKISKAGAAVTIDTTAPDAVTRLIAEAPWGGENRVSWAATASTDVYYYELYRAESAEALATAKPYQSVSSLEFIDTKIIPGVTYYYAVKAVDKAENASALSPIASAKAIAGDGPPISLVSVTPAGRPLRPGDVLTVTLAGASAGTATADIEGLVTGLELKESRGTGAYVGTYIVKAADIGDARLTAKVVGSLTDAYGSSKLAGPDVLVISQADLNDKTPPVVKEISHNAWNVAGLSGKLVPGDVLTVTATGEAAGIATFTLDGINDSVPMTEGPAGTYTGSYTIEWDDDVAAAAVAVSLSDFAGNVTTLAADKPLALDTRLRIIVTAKDALLPADRASKTRIVVRAEDANGNDVKGRELSLTLSTTEEYTGVVGGGMVENKFASIDDEDDIEVKWGGVTDAFGEIAATYTAGFAAKTALIVAKDLATGDVGAGWLNTYVASTLAIKLTPRVAKGAEMAALRLSLSPSWLTADGRSKSRVKAWVTTPAGQPIENAKVNFAVGGTNGTIKVVRGVADANGLAEADYRAGTLAGMVNLIISAPDYGVSQTIAIELRSDAPAKIAMGATLLTLPADGVSTTDLRALVSDINDNPNKNVPVLLSVIEGSGSVAPDENMTDRNGIVRAKYTAGRTAGTAVVEARHTSRSPTEDELRRVYGTVFVPRLFKDQERTRVVVMEWLVKSGDEVAKGQPLVKLSANRETWTLAAPEKGVFVREVRHKKDRVELGDTIGYVEIDPQVWDDIYTN